MPITTVLCDKTIREIGMIKAKSKRIRNFEMSLKRRVLLRFLALFSIYCHLFSLKITRPRKIVLLIFEKRSLKIYIVSNFFNTVLYMSLFSFINDSHGFKNSGVIKISSSFDAVSIELQSISKWSKYE